MTCELLLWLPLVIVGLVLAVVGAMVVWIRLRVEPTGPSSITPIGPTERIPQDVSRALAVAEERLTRLGFARQGRLITAGNAQSCAYASVLVSEDRLVLAHGVVHAAKIGSAQRVAMTSLELSTRMDAGPNIVTSDNDAILMTDRLTSYWRFPFCRDADSLVKIHRTIVGAAGGEPVPLEDRPGAWLSRMTEDAEAVWRACLDAGMFERSGRAGPYRYRWAWALREVVGALPIIRTLRRADSRRQARRMLDEHWLGSLWRTG